MFKCVCSFLLIFLFSCSSSEIEEDNIPFCVLAEFNSLKDDNQFLKIRRQMINDEYHFWINTGANAYDGDEDIVDSNCDVVCQYRGWFPAECIDQYEFERWEVILEN